MIWCWVYLVWVLVASAWQSFARRFVTRGEMSENNFLSASSVIDESEHTSAACHSEQQQRSSSSFGQSALRSERSVRTFGREANCAPLDSSCGHVQRGCFILSLFIVLRAHVCVYGGAGSVQETRVRFITRV